MKHHMVATGLLGLAVAFCGTTPAAAQQVHSFEQLQAVVKPGDTVLVTDTTGTTTKGRIDTLTSESLRLSANDIVREFSQKDTRLVRQRKSDSLKNGAIIGAATGAGVASVMVGVLCAAFGDCPAAGVAGYIGMFAAMGTGVGVGVDALITSSRTLYQSPPKGVTVSFSF